MRNRDWGKTPRGQELMRLAAERYRKKDPQRARDKVRRCTLKRSYGLSVEDYDSMFSRQGGRCALCGSPPKKCRLAVDHDHNTGRIRGLLCTPCNSAMGRFDNLEWMTRAKEYA